MRALTPSTTLKATAKAKGLKKWCMYVGIHDPIDQEDEILKAAPCLLKLESFFRLGFIEDGGGILVFRTEALCRAAYDSTVGEDGPTKTNPYDGPVHVYCLTCDDKGILHNENT